MVRYLYRSIGMLGALVAILEDCVIQTFLACLIVFPFHFATVSDPSLSELPLIAGLMFVVATVYELGRGVYFGVFSDAGDAGERAIDEE